MSMIEMEERSNSHDHWSNWLENFILKKCKNAFKRKKLLKVINKTDQVSC